MGSPDDTFGSVTTVLEWKVRKPENTVTPGTYTFMCVALDNSKGARILGVLHDKPKDLLALMVLNHINRVLHTIQGTPCRWCRPGWLPGALQLAC
jgi:hypothetical protein